MLLLWASFQRAWQGWQLCGGYHAWRLRPEKSAAQQANLLERARRQHERLGARLLGERRDGLEVGVLGVADELEERRLARHDKRAALCGRGAFGMHWGVLVCEGVAGVRPRCSTSPPAQHDAAHTTHSAHAHKTNINTFYLHRALQADGAVARALAADAVD